MLTRMSRRAWLAGRVCVLAAVLGAAVHADTYTVSSDANSGGGSLRSAIRDANDHIGADTIAFTEAMATRTISITSALPSITDGSLTIDGDLDDDGAPDIVIDGSTTFNTGCLTVEANDCIIVGLAIVNWGFEAIALQNATGCEIYSCHLGVDKAGAVEQPCGGGALRLDHADGNRIGGTTADERNVMAGQLGFATVAFFESNDNVFAGNYVGVTRDGAGVLRPGDNLTVSRYGLGISKSTGNTIGGTGAADRNVFAGLRMGIWLNDYSTDNTVLGNTFGLAADGDTVLGITTGIWVSLTSDNTIGGTTAGARNVFVSGSDEGMPAQGIWVAPNYAGASSSDCSGNRIRGNYFGLNVAGTAQRALETGVLIQQKTPATTPPGAQTIGGNTSAHGNWFCCSLPGLGASPRGVWFYEGGDRSTVRHNKFGVYPVKGVGTPSNLIAGVRIENVDVTVRDNSIYRCGSGVRVLNADGCVRAYGNLLSDCIRGVYLTDSSHAWLGDLGNVSPGDDGGNTFRTTTDWHVYNATPNAIKAEGNDWGATTKVAINARIWDRKDDPSLGRVDFDPLEGGVSPTGDTTAVQVTGACAVPTAGGSEIAFTLSAPAEVTVTVLNIAGRPVATVLRDRRTEAGLQQVVWNAQSAAGTRVPAGQYLVRVTAKAADGAQAQAVAQVRVGR